MSTSEQVQAERAFGIELVQYAGRWVAVRDRTVLADDETLGTLLDQLNGQRETAEIFKVREDPAAPCS